MPRKPRPELAGGIFHVYARGNDRRELFLDSTDRRTYLRLLGQTTRAKRWRSLAYCLMPNHVHLLIETPDGNLAAGMHALHSPYAKAFNKRHGRTGHVFEKRYGAVPVTTDAYMLTVVRYIAMNPVSAGIVSRAADWTWSSHRGMSGEVGSPSWLATSRLAELLSAWAPDGRSVYEELVPT
jgi:REP element-mobilizing transposase RayT